jgi:hypothetical protein
MANFAELDEYNRVKRVLVASNEDVINNGGEQSVEAAQFFETVVPLSPGGVRYVQTSYNGNFRREFAGEGGFYNDSLDVFYGERPYASWTLDSNAIWQPPIPEPITNDYYVQWDEKNLRWIGYATGDDVTRYIWNPITLTWSVE